MEIKPFIESVHLKNFLLFEDIEIPLQSGITVLTGRNGSGKSLFLDALRLGLGLSSRNLRMDRIDQYLRDKEKPAEIELIINNPALVGEDHLFKSTNVTVNAKYFSDEKIKIKRMIQTKGRGTDFYIHSTKGWEKLSPDERDALIEAFLNIGINPKDELAFVPAEDFLNFMGKTGSERLSIFKQKIGLDTLEEKYRQMNEKTNSLKNEFARVDLDDLKVKEKIKDDELNHQKWLERQELEKSLDILNEEKKWAKILKAKNVLDGTNENLKRKKDDLTAKQSEMESIGKEKIKIEEQKNSIEKEHDTASNLLNTQNTQKNQIEGAISNLIQGKNEKQRMEGGKRGDIARLTREIDDLNVDLKKLSSEGVDNKQIKSLELRVIEIDKDIIKLKQEHADIEEERDSRKKELSKRFEEELKSIAEKIKELQDQEVELRAAKSSGKGKDRDAARGKQNKLMLHENFIEELGKNGIRNFLGPVCSKLQMQSGEEAWTDVVSACLNNILEDFIALDRDTFKKMDRLTREDDRFRKIKIGGWFLNEVDQKLYEGKMDFHDVIQMKKQFPEIYNTVEGLIGGDKHVLAYARLYSSMDNILLDTIDRDKAQKIGEAFQDKRLRFMTRNSIPITVRARGTVLASNPIYTTLKIGESVEVDLSPDDQMNTIRQKIKMYQEQEHELRNQKVNINLHQDVKALTDEANEKMKEIGRLEAEKQKIKKQMIEKDPTKVTALKQEEIEQKTEELNKVKAEYDLIIKDIKKFEKDIDIEQAKLEKIQTGIRDAQDKFNTKKKDFDKVQKQFNDVNTKIKQITDEMKNLNNTIKKIDEDLSKNITEQETLLKEMKGKKQPSTKIETEERIQGRIDEVSKRIKGYLTITKEMEDIYQEKLKQFKEFDVKKKQLKKNIELLEKESAEWSEKISSTLNEKLDAINNSFNEILGTINATGNIIIESPDDQKNAGLGIFVQYTGEPLRSLEQHSSGQKQAAIIALVIAMQSQLISPITAIDEFDKGLDPVNKRRIIEVIPKMIEKAMNSKKAHYIGHLAAQYLIILPDLIGDNLPQNVNYMTCVRSNNLSQISKV